MRRHPGGQPADQPDQDPAGGGRPAGQVTLTDRLLGGGVVGQRRQAAPWPTVDLRHAASPSPIAVRPGRTPSSRGYALLAPKIAGVSESEWVDYQACPREVRHVRLGSGPCRLCAQPAAPDRALTSAGKFHWLCWQQQLDWADRYRPGRVLDLTSDDFVTWATANPAQHREYLSFLAAAATFGTDDFPRPTRGYAAGARPAADHGHPAARRHRRTAGAARPRPLGLRPGRSPGALPRPGPVPHSRPAVRAASRPSGGPRGVRSASRCSWVCGRTRRPARRSG